MCVIQTSHAAISIPGGVGCVANDVNASGVIVGSCYVNGVMQAFAWDGAARTLQLPSGVTGSCVANAINTAGRIAGTCGARTAVVWEVDGSATVIPDMWTAEDINDAGDIAGSMLGYVWTGSTYGWGWGGEVPARYRTSTGQLTGYTHNAYPTTTGVAYSINSAGMLAGQFGRYFVYYPCFRCTVESRVPTGFRETPGFQWLSAPYYPPSDSLQSASLAHNDGGMAAGWITVVGTTWRNVPSKAVIYPAGNSMYTHVPLAQGLNNWGMSHDVNNDGIVVGEYQNSAGVLQAFIWRSGTSSATNLPVSDDTTSAGARAISARGADGKVTVVGYATVGGVQRAMVWRLPAP